MKHYMLVVATLGSTRSMLLLLLIVLSFAVSGWFLLLIPVVLLKDIIAFYVLFRVMRWIHK